ncbi:hypothetical protein GCM10009037_17240 [Halarchaeum grantii]|uniref:DUF8107 domain-containing protein n=1 Tax=Halarchaeum grantii TaxID=1193105 RepID=A0A830EVM5_9EURY|nr:hypothetical protein [Halarchaeum grantii]GGL34182.1 hypothetical protein GCM10009037_17240 [Halarchaeum grantii]
MENTVLWLDLGFRREITTRGEETPYLVDGNTGVIYPLAALLSPLFVLAVVYGASIVGYPRFSPLLVITIAVALLVLTYLAVLR